MKSKVADLLNNLILKTLRHIADLEAIKTLTNKELSFRIDQNSWNILECIQHLNLYLEFYLPEIERKIKKNSSKAPTLYKSGILGNYLANIILPKEKSKSMKALKSMSPVIDSLDRKIIQDFIINENKLLILLELAKESNINRIQIPTAIHKLIKISLGDTLRFIINHNARHFKQIDNIRTIFRT